MDDKNELFGRLAVERGYMAREKLAEARGILRAIKAMGMEQSLAQVAVGKGLLTRDQAQELANAVAVQTGESRLVAGYEVISKLGQGGMGTVYKAKRLEDGRLVALKILPPSLATDELISRFLREARIISRLQHANIVGCVEFGLDPKRKCYFCAMDLVEGEDMAKRIGRLGTIGEDEAISTAIQIAGALQHAFDNGLVHRDVKPENIMVTADGRAKLLDLGLARSATVEATRLTQSGMFVGSPYYASPEQGMGEGEVDIRSDIYSLGATLYHIVTGRTPFEGGTALAVLRKHLEEKLPWPADVNPAISENLCRIIARMMAKDPDDRYQSPGEVVSDLAVYRSKGIPQVSEKALESSTVAPSFTKAAEEMPAEPKPVDKDIGEMWAPPPPRLDHAAIPARVPMLMPGKIPEVARRESDGQEPNLSIGAAGDGIEEAEEVADGRPGVIMRWRSLATPWKFVLPAAGAFAFLTLLVVIVLTVSDGDGDLSSRRVDRMASAGSARHRAARGRIERAKRIERAREAFENAKAFLSKNPGHFREATTRLQAVQAEAEGTDLGLEVEIKREIEAVRGLWDEAARVSLARASAEAMRIAAEGDFDRAVAALRAIPEDLVSRVAREIRAESEGLSREAWLKIHAEAAKIEEQLGRGEVAGARSALEGLEQLRFSEGGAELAELLESLRATIARADAAAKKAARERRAQEASRELLGREAPDERPVQLGRFKHEGPVSSVAFSPAGRMLVTSSADRTVRIWDVARAAALHVLHSYAGEVLDAEFNPRGDRLVTASADWTARVWDVRTGKEMQTLSGHSHKVRSAEWSPDGRRIVTCSDDKTIRVWNAVTGSEVAALRGHTSWVVCVAFNSYGDRIVTASDDRTVRIWDARSGRELHRLTGHSGRIYGARFSPDETMVVTASADGTARTWHAAMGKALVTLQGHTAAVYAASFSPDGRRIITASEDCTARTWDAGSGRPGLILREHGEPVRAAEFSPDGRRILTASDDHTACVWDAETGREIDVLRGPACEVSVAVWSPKGGHIATASADGTVIVWGARGKPAK